MKRQKSTMSYEAKEHLDSIVCVARLLGSVNDETIVSIVRAFATLPTSRTWQEREAILAKIDPRLVELLEAAGQLERAPWQHFVPSAPSGGSAPKRKQPNQGPTARALAKAASAPRVGSPSKPAAPSPRRPGRGRGAAAPAASPPPAPPASAKGTKKRTSSRAAGSGPSTEVDDQVLGSVRRLPGRSVSAIALATGLTLGATKAALRRLQRAGRVRVEGSKRASVWMPEPSRSPEPPQPSLFGEAE